MAERERPVTWAEWKAQHRWPRLISIEWALEWLVYWCKSLAIFEVLEFAGRASVLIALLVWFWEADDRKKQSHYRAWELINSARDSTGDGGRIDALQDLNEDGVPLYAAPLANAFLIQVQLPKAKLFKANLTKANLIGANLTEAFLSSANLTGADLSVANLTKASLSSANLTKAFLHKTNLTGASLSSANLTEADLNSTDLTGADLKSADLTKASLYNVNLTGADLSEAKLAGANLLRTNLTGAKLENVKFCQTTMPDDTLNNRDCLPDPPKTKKPK